MTIDEVGIITPEGIKIAKRLNAELISIENEAVKIADVQTITGEKTFAAGKLKANDITSEDDFIISTAANKTSVLSQPVYDDIIVPMSRTRQPNSNYPTWGTFVSPTIAPTFAVNNYVDFGFEIPHSYKEGTNIDIHCHGATNGTEITTKAIKFEMQLSIGIASTTSAVSAAFGAIQVYSAEFEIPANTSDKAGFVFKIGDIVGTNIKIGSQIIAQFKRILATGTAPQNNPFLTTVGFHYQIDTQGSRQPYVK